MRGIYFTSTKTQIDLSFKINGIFQYVVFNKGIHGEITGVDSTNIENDPLLIDVLRKRAKERIEYDAERLASR